MLIFDRISGFDAAADARHVALICFYLWLASSGHDRDGRRRGRATHYFSQNMLATQDFGRCDRATSRVSAYIVKAY